MKKVYEMVINFDNGYEVTVKHRFYDEVFSAGGYKSIEQYVENQIDEICEYFSLEELFRMPPKFKVTVNTLYLKDVSK